MSVFDLFNLFDLTFNCLFLRWFRSKTLERRWQFVVGLDFVCFNLLKNSPTALIFHCMLSQFHWVAHGLFHHLPKSHQCSKFEFERWYLIGCSTFWYSVDAIFNRWQVWTSAENQLIFKKNQALHCTTCVCVCVYGKVIDWNWFAPWAHAYVHLYNIRKKVKAKHVKYDEYNACWWNTNSFMTFDPRFTCRLQYGLSFLFSFV